MKRWSYLKIWKLIYIILEWNKEKQNNTQKNKRFHLNTKRYHHIIQNLLDSTFLEPSIYISSYTVYLTDLAFYPVYNQVHRISERSEVIERKPGHKTFFHFFTYQFHFISFCL